MRCTKGGPLTTTERATGLIIVTDLPRWGRVAIMQARGHFDPERMDYETWPGHVQVTCYGCVQPGDCCLVDAMLREAKEELGPIVGQMVAEARHHVRLLEQYHSHGREVTLYCLYWPDPSWMRQIVLHPASGGLRLLSECVRNPYAKYFTHHDRAALRAIQVVS